MIEISAVVGSTIGFDREIWVGGVAGVGDVEIENASERKVGGVFLLSWMEIVFKIGLSE